VVAAVKRVAQQLGNRPATCRKYYIHPAMLEAYSDGTLFSTMEAGEQQQAAYGGLGLKPEEYCVMVIIAADQERLAGEARAKGIGSHRRSRRSSRRPQKTLVGAALAVSR
jgi:DNA topoisomerase-1